MVIAAKESKIKRFIYASTSSVYGENKSFPLKETSNTDNPISFYAATKKSNEVMAYSYSYIYKLRCTGLRFFTVYGPYGRPDMSLFKFTKAILNSSPVKLFNKGNHIRDFTYIDDVVNMIEKILFFKKRNKVPFNIFNIGSNNPTHLKSYVKLIEKKLQKNVKISNKKFQKGDIYKTHASINKIFNLIKLKPKTELKSGIGRFVDWYKSYYKL